MPPLQQRLPQDILSAIYEIDPTFRDHYHDMLNRDVQMYQTPQKIHYIPCGIHSLIFSPRLWALETDQPIHVQTPLRQFRILRFFLHHQEFQDYVQKIMVPLHQYVSWNQVQSFLQQSFVSLG
jgi:hypothetical protein